MINKIEDIYPMTIVNMRYGKFAIVEACCNADCVNSLEGNEEWSYDPHHFMKEEWEHINYGVGNTILEAFEDFKKRSFKKIVIIEQIDCVGVKLDSFELIPSKRESIARSRVYIRTVEGKVLGCFKVYDDETIEFFDTKSL